MFIFFLSLQGLNNKLLFSHHKSDHTENLVSWYDQHYNKKERPVSDQLPEFRHWDGNRLAWEPEASDHPIRGWYWFTIFSFLEKCKEL